MVKKPNILYKTIKYKKVLTEREFHILHNMNTLDLSSEHQNLGQNTITLDTIIPTSDPYLRQALIEVHDFKCFYSRDPITADTLHVEHIHPRALN